MQRVGGAKKEGGLSAAEKDGDQENDSFPNLPSTMKPLLTITVFYIFSSLWLWWKARNRHSDLL